MAIVSYRIYCDGCTNDKVIREDNLEDSDWKINSKAGLSGVCPACNDMKRSDDSSITFENLDNIGESGAENLRDAGIVTHQDVQNASDDEILDIAWVGEKGLKSIRDAV